MGEKSPGQDIIVNASGLAKHFGEIRAVDNVELQIFRGEVLSIVGANGAGKTTLLRLISGLMNWEREITRGLRKEVSNIILGGEVWFKGAYTWGMFRAPGHRLCVRRKDRAGKTFDARKNFVDKVHRRQTFSMVFRTPLVQRDTIRLPLTERRYLNVCGL
jgi:energy-coupling factor transporter ATP-binding protein EcfA2